MKSSSQAVTFGVTPALSWIVLIAKALNLFKKNDVNINFRTFLAGKQAIHGLEKGWVDMANVIDVNVASLANLHKINTRLLGYTHAREDGHVAAHADCGIHAPNDLKGKRVAVMLGTSSHVFLLDFLRHYNLDPEVVHMVDMRVDHMEKAMLRNEVDACSAWQPYIQNLQRSAAQNGTELTVMPNLNFSRFFVLLGANTKSLKKKHDDIQKVIQVLDQTVAHIHAHTEDVQILLNNELNLPSIQLKDIVLSPDKAITAIPATFWQQVHTHFNHIAPNGKHTIDDIIHLTHPSR